MRYPDTTSAGPAWDGHSIAVLGAGGRLGAALVAALHRKGLPVRALRHRGRASLPDGIDPVQADATDPASLRAALAGVSAVATTIPPGLLPAVLDALPDTCRRLAITGSARRYTRFPDVRSRLVAEAEARFLARGIPGVLLHPTMIYGGAGENNVARVAAYVRRFGVVPLPGGGTALIQPIHADDVVACLVAALTRPLNAPEVVVAPGPSPIAYAGFVRAIASAIGQRVRILPLPARLLMAAAPLTALLPGLPRIRADEVRRLLEDKAFDPGPLRDRLGIEPIGLAEGLARTFGCPALSGSSDAEQPRKG